MALPTTNLTFHADASDADHVWEQYQGTTPYHNTTASNNSPVEVWDDDDGKDLTLLVYVEASGFEPDYRVTTPLMVLPCLEFNGSTDVLLLYNNAGVVAQPISGLLGASAFVVAAAFYLEGASSNDANSYDNDGFLVDNGGFWGIHFKNNAGAYSVLAYNYSGGDQAVSLSLNLNTSYVLVYWHTGGSIFAELYDATGLVASGNTASGNSSFAAFAVLGKSFGNTYFNGRIGEIATYSAHDATDRGNATTYFRNKWTPAAGRVTKNTRANPLGTEIGMGWRMEP